MLRTKSLRRSLTVGFGLVFVVIVLTSACGDTAASFPLSDSVELRVGEQRRVEVLENDYPQGSLMLEQVGEPTSPVVKVGQTGNAMDLTGLEVGTTTVRYQVAGPSGSAWSHISVSVFDGSVPPTVTPIPPTAIAASATPVEIAVGPTPDTRTPTVAPVPPTPTVTPTSTVPPTPTFTPVPPTPTFTPVPPTPSVTPVPPTLTPVPPTPTFTPVPPSFAVELFQFGYKEKTQISLPAVLVGAITNTGSVAITDLQVGLASPDQTLFIEGNGCGPSLAPGEQCGGFVLHDPAPMYLAGEHQVSLTATAGGVQASAALTFTYPLPRWQDFVIEPPNWTNGDTITITNTRYYDAVIKTTEDANSAATVGPSCSVPVGLSCEITATRTRCFFKIEAEIPGFGRVRLPSTCVR